MTRTPLLFAGLLALLFTGSGLARAQETIVIDGRESAVIVDLSVLDHFAPKGKPVKKPRTAQAQAPAPAPSAAPAPAPAPVPTPAAPGGQAKPGTVKKPATPAKPPAAESAAAVPVAPKPAAGTAKPPATATAPAQATGTAEANANPSIPDSIAPATRLSFAAGSEEMDAAASALVDALVAENGSGARVVQVRAYAAGSGETNSAARRLSLKRAVAVRSYMIHKGMQAARIDVRALGPAPDAGPADRVDIVIMP